VTGEPPEHEVEIFLYRAAAESLLEECLRNESEWVGLPRLIPIELDDATSRRTKHVSAWRRRDPCYQPCYQTERTS
jgi:hypothetical protein